jgi:hypothetical protein
METLNLPFEDKDQPQMGKMPAARDPG